MKVAIIIPSSDFIRIFYNIGIEIKKMGHQVIYILENKYEIYKANMIGEFTNESVFYVIDYLTDNNNYQDMNWISIIPNFERMSLYGQKHDSKTLNRYISTVVKLWDDIFKNENVDIVFNEPPADVKGLVAHQLSENYGIKYIGLWSTPFQPLIYFDSTLFGDLNTSNINYSVVGDKKYNISKLSHEIYANYEKKLSTDFYMDDNPYSEKYSLFSHYFKKLNLINRYIKFICGNNGAKKSFERGNPFSLSFNLLLREGYKKINIKYLNFRRIYDDANYGGKYIIYPMHFRPEATTSVQAWPFLDEINVIRNLSFSLPHNYVLLVKPHPNSVGSESFQFYNKIKNIPRVKLINHKTDVINLIKNSCGVATLSGTMGFESLMLKKPILIFGKAFYNSHPFAYEVKDLFNLPTIIKKVVSSKIDNKIFDDYNKYLINEYTKKAFRGHPTITDKPIEVTAKIICIELIKYYNDALGINMHK
jgi:hypothetical protein